MHKDLAYTGESGFRSSRLSLPPAALSSSMRRINLYLRLLSVAYRLTRLSAYLLNFPRYLIPCSDLPCPLSQLLICLMENFPLDSRSRAESASFGIRGERNFDVLLRPRATGRFYFEYVPRTVEGVVFCGDFDWICVMSELREYPRNSCGDRTLINYLPTRAARHDRFDGNLFVYTASKINNGHKVFAA